MRPFMTEFCRRTCSPGIAGGRRACQGGAKGPACHAIHLACDAMSQEGRQDPFGAENYLEQPPISLLRPGIDAPDRCVR